MYLFEKITTTYSWAKTFYKTKVEHYPVVDYFFKGLNESVKLISFLRPTITTASTILLKQTQALYYSSSAKSMESKENVANATLQLEEKKARSDLTPLSLTATSELKPEMKEWMVIPPLTTSTTDSELMQIVFLESFKLNATYLSKLVLYYSLIHPLIHPFMRLAFYLQGNTSEEAYANAEDLRGGIDLLAFIFFIRDAIDLLVQNQAFTKLITAIAKKHTPFALHAAKCNDKKEICTHLHSCGCPTHLMNQADTDSALYYISNLKLLSIPAQLSSFIGCGIHFIAKWLADSQFTYLPINKLFAISNLMAKTSLLTTIIGAVLEILAEGWCIGEYRLAIVRMCTEHRYTHLKVKENYSYYFALGLGSLLINTFLYKFFSIITGLSGFTSIFISIPLSAFLFQGYIASILNQKIIFKKTSEECPDVFYYHRKISDVGFRKLFNYLTIKLNDQKFRQSLAKFEIPLKLALFILLKPSLRSLKLLAKKPAINLYFCWEKENIDTYMYWARMTQSLPNSTTTYIAKAVSFAPSWMVSESISLFVGLAERYGINKLIKQLEEFLTLVQCEHPSMRANDAYFYTSLTVKENKSESATSKKEDIFEPLQEIENIFPSTRQENFLPTTKQENVLLPTTNEFKTANITKSLLELSKNKGHTFDKPLNVLTLALPHDNAPKIAEVAQKAQKKEENTNENEKWVWVNNNNTSLRKHSLFTYASKFMNTNYLPSSIRNFRYFG
ncbi:MAG: hypothetical protein JO131_07825 [Gammaproteobacteria bacterium]|nr:hypothetical protein [Gammaproteobacteria bacterium]